MWLDEYLKRANGRKPVEEWLQGLSVEERAVVKSKMQALRENGVDLIKIDTLRVIKNKTKKEKRDKHLYELVCGNYRIGTHFDTNRQTFVYLSAFKKQKNIQPKDIKLCRARLNEYFQIGTCAAYWACFFENLAVN